MTYQEIKDRLSKCESTLEQLKNGSVKPTEKITVKNLEVLKESLEKQLSEVDKGVVYTDDEAKAKDLADKGANVKLTSEMKPGDEEDLERRRFNNLSRKDQNTLIAIKAMMDKEKSKNEAPDGPPIDKMTRADCIDFLNTTPEKVKDISDEELRDACRDKNADLRETEYDTTVSEQPADAPADLSEAVDPSITDLLVQFVTLMGMGYGAYQAAKKLSDKHGDIDLDSIKAALSKKEETDDNEDMYKPAKLRKLTVGGKTYELGEEDPNDDGNITSIQKYPNGYHITGQDGSHGYGYALDLDGFEMDEEDLEGMYESKEKDDYGRNHYPEKGEYTKLSDEEREAMKKDKLGMNENEIGDADDNVGTGYKNARDIINYLREKIYPYMNDAELQEFNDEMHTHFASNSSRFVKEGEDICSCCDNPIVNGSCGCPDDCPHCGGKGKVDEGVGKTKKAYDLLVNKMKELAKQYKAGDKSVVDQLKDLTAKKRKLEDMLDQDVSNIGKDQELTEGRGDMEEIHAIIRQRAIESGETTPIEAAEIIMDLADEYDIDLDTIKQDYFEEGKYKSDAQRKAIYATKAEKEKNEEKRS